MIAESIEQREDIRSRCQLGLEIGSQLLKLFPEAEINDLYSMIASALRHAFETNNPNAPFLQGVWFALGSPQNLSNVVGQNGGNVVYGTRRKEQ